MRKIVEVKNFAVRNKNPRLELHSETEWTKCVLRTQFLSIFFSIWRHQFFYCPIFLNLCASFRSVSCARSLASAKIEKRLVMTCYLGQTQWITLSRTAPISILGTWLSDTWLARYIIHLSVGRYSTRTQAHLHFQWTTEIVQCLRLPEIWSECGHELRSAYNINIVVCAVCHSSSVNVIVQFYLITINCCCLLVR